MQHWSFGTEFVELPVGRFSVGQFSSALCSGEWAGAGFFVSGYIFFLNFFPNFFRDPGFEAGQGAGAGAGFEPAAVRSRERGRFRD